LKDWSISRQRYWGCPIPIIHCAKCGPQAVPDDQLPVLLPRVDNYQPKGRSPLADVPEFMAAVCPKCGGKAERDPDTMDTFVCSSWYYLRYCDAKNAAEPFDKGVTNAWMPVDLYIGGITHATGHLIYFRFFQKFLKDIGWLDDDEPALRLFNHGMVMDAKGEVMSKSKGNAVSPITLMEERGTDIARLAMYFTAPSEKEVLWSNEGITGVEKFVLNKLMPLVESYRSSKPDLKRYFKPSALSDQERTIYVKLNQTVKRVSDSVDRLQFNTAISALMELIRDFDPAVVKNITLNDQIVLKTIQMVAPMAPHVAEELWEQAGFTDSVFKSTWPECDHEAIQGDTIGIAIQVNGKLRDTIRVSTGANQSKVESEALASAKVLSHVGGKEILKKIYVPGRLLNIVVKG
jgi:leucyl-tRNA synthetase